MNETLFSIILIIIELNGFFSATGVPRIAFTAAVILPIVNMLVAIYSYRPLKRIVEAMSTETFLLLQHMRSVFGVLFFFAAGLPIWFQYLGGLGDIAAGMGAFFALNYLRKNPDKERQAILVGNFAGILDFIIVINFGVLVVLKDHSADIMFNLIPLYVVPLFILFHIFSLLKLNKLRAGLSNDSLSGGV